MVSEINKPIMIWRTPGPNHIWAVGILHSYGDGEELVDLKGFQTFEEARKSIMGLPEAWEFTRREIETA